MPGAEAPFLFRDCFPGLKAGAFTAVLLASTGDNEPCG
jgi:hypothetical protein